MRMNSILILDDDRTSLDLITHFLGTKLSTKLVTTRFPTHAIQLASDSCFDLVLVDVTIDYNGTQFGGLEVYKALHSRYGNSSILAYSQYITDDLIQRYGLPFNFIEKDINLVEWIPKLVEQSEKLRNQQTCFIAMPFGPEFAEVFQAISISVAAAGYRPIRIDGQIFTRSIVDLIYEEIRRAKLVIFVATARNPNVFYEAGFAVALHKEVITVTDELSQLPFDIRDRSAIAYGKDMDLLQMALQEKLIGLTKVR
jgi:hypothetical protein